MSLGAVVHAYNPSMWEAEAGQLSDTASSKPALDV
jgi:hypothetical protein